MKMKKKRAGYSHKSSRVRAIVYRLSLILLACVSTGAVVWFLYNDIVRENAFTLHGDESLERVKFTGNKRNVVDWASVDFPYSSRKKKLTTSAFEQEEEVYTAGDVPRQLYATRQTAGQSSSVRRGIEDESGVIRESGGFVKLPEAHAETLLAARTQNKEPVNNAVRRRHTGAGPASSASSVLERPVAIPSALPVRVEVVKPEYIQPETVAAGQAWEGKVLAENGGDGMFTLGLNDGYEAQVPAFQPAEIESPKVRPSRKVPAVASDSAYANPYGKPLDPDDLFSLKLHAMYGTSKADFEDESLGRFKDQFLVLGGKKKIEFAGMDEMDIAFDGIITTSGTWDSDSMRQDLSGITLNVGPEFKLPELPLKFETNLGVGWLKRDATIFDDDGDLARADIDSFVYGGGLALRGDWQWRMLKMSGMAGVQYAAANEKSHQFRTYDGSEFGDEVPKTTYSAWEVPLQLRASGEYRLLDALTISPALWGGYNYNITGKNGPFHSGHLAGAETTWRRNGVTWNKSHWNLGGEVRLNIVDRINLWFEYQKEWASGDSGSYYGGGLQIAF